MIRAEVVEVDGSTEGSPKKKFLFAAQASQDNRMQIAVESGGTGSGDLRRLLEATLARCGGVGTAKEVYAGPTLAKYWDEASA